MSTINNGGQTLTFDYKQEGTSQGFNRLFHKLISPGIINGGNISIVTGTSVSIAPLVAVVRDESKNLSVRLETTTNATVSVSVSTPYIVGRFSWLNVEDNYMDFEAVGYSELEDTDIIFGRCVYDSSILTNIDYTRKTWAQVHYEQPNNEPPFVTYMHEVDNKLLVGKGSAYINGKYVNYTSVQESPLFSTAVTNGRIDILVIDSSGTLSIIEGTDSVNPVMPQIPYGTLAIAKVTLPRNPSKLSGNMVEYIYNNHYQSSNSPTEFSQLSNELQLLVRACYTPNLTCETNADVQIKEVSDPIINSLVPNQKLTIKFTNGSTYKYVEGELDNWGQCEGLTGTTGNATVNTISEDKAPKISLNGGTAYPIKVGGEFAGEGFINANDVHEFVFDGSAWNDVTADVIYKGEVTDGNYVKKRNGLITEWGKSNSNKTILPYEVVNKTIYSTDEIVIGTWIDGKPIYRRIFENLNFTIINLSWITISIVNNFNYITKAVAFENGGNNLIEIIEKVPANNNSIKIETATGGNRSCNKLLLEYTKTTD